MPRALYCRECRWFHLFAVPHEASRAELSQSGGLVKDILVLYDDLELPLRKSRLITRVLSTQSAIALTDADMLENLSFTEHDLKSSLGQGMFYG